MRWIVTRLALTCMLVGAITTCRSARAQDGSSPSNNSILLQTPSLPKHWAAKKSPKPPANKALPARGARRPSGPQQMLIPVIPVPETPTVASGKEVIISRKVMAVGVIPGKVEHTGERVQPGAVPQRRRIPWTWIHLLPQPGGASHQITGKPPVLQPASSVSWPPAYAAKPSVPPAKVPGLHQQDEPSPQKANPRIESGEGEEILPRAIDQPGTASTIPPLLREMDLPD